MVTISSADHSRLLVEYSVGVAGAAIVPGVFAEGTQLDAAGNGVAVVVTHIASRRSEGGRVFLIQPAGVGILKSSARRDSIRLFEYLKGPSRCRNGIPKFLRN